MDSDIYFQTAEYHSLQACLYSHISLFRALFFQLQCGLIDFNVNKPEMPVPRVSLKELLEEISIVESR